MGSEGEKGENVSETNLGSEPPTIQGNHPERMAYSLRGYKANLTKLLNELDEYLEKFESVDPAIGQTAIKNLLHKIEAAKDKVLGVQLFLLKKAENYEEGEKYTADINSIDTRVQISSDKAALYLGVLSTKISENRTRPNEDKSLGGEESENFTPIINENLGFNGARPKTTNRVAVLPPSLIPGPPPPIPSPHPPPPNPSPLPKVPQANAPFAGPFADNNDYEVVGQSVAQELTFLR